MRSNRRTVLRFLGVSAAGSIWPTATFAGKQNFSAQDSVKPGYCRVEWLQAPCGIDARRPRFSWTLDAHDCRARNLHQSAFRIMVASSIDDLRNERGDVWDSGKRLGATLRARADSDLFLASQSSYWWSVMVWDQNGRPSRWSAPAPFTTGILNVADWRARWIAVTPDRIAPAGPPSAGGPPDPVAPQALPLFRKTFQLAKRVRQAIVCVAGLGQYELRINARPVGRGVLNPGWTNYRKTVLYNTFDVTTFLKQGLNAIGIMLGNGMYNSELYAHRYTKFVGTYGQPKLILQLKIVFDDGSEGTIISDASWSTRAGPITLSSTYGGEDFDAQHEPLGWDGADHSNEGWSDAHVVSGPGGVLYAQGIPSVATARLLKPVAITEPRPGVFVYDFGLNFAGWPNMTLQGPAGKIVQLTPGELLDESGLVTQRSAGVGPASAILFNYTLKGGGEEHWHPRFSYTGFRYLQIEGAVPKGHFAPDTPIVLSLEGVELRIALAQTGTFDTSDNLAVRIHRIILQALHSNTFSVLTDCPTREKLGWLEQSYLNADTVFYNEDAITIYEKMLGDMRDSQLENGLVPATAPEYAAFVEANGENTAFRDSPEWGAAVVLSPWAAFRYYGDTKILETGYSAMRRYADFLSQKTQDGLLDYGLGDWYDIGPRALGVAQLTSKMLTATASYYTVLTTLAKIAGILHKSDDARSYAQHAKSVKEAFNAKLFDPQANSYDSGSQTANAMPLVLGLVPEGREDAVLETLVADIRAKKNHVSAGDVGFHYVVQALLNGGRGDVLFDLLSRRDAPSYADQLAKGATALTEAWDANRSSSQNHFMLGHIESWLYGGLAGVRIDMSAPEGERISIMPQPVVGVAAAHAAYRSVLGDVACTWQKRNKHLLVRVAVPPGARACVTLPDRSPSRMRENGKPLAQAKGILKVEAAQQRSIVTVGSGCYDFSVPWTL